MRSLLGRSWLSQWSANLPAGVSTPDTAPSADWTRPVQGSVDCWNLLPNARQQAVSAASAARPFCIWRGVQCPSRHCTYSTSEHVQSQCEGTAAEQCFAQPGLERQLTSNQVTSACLCMVEMSRNGSSRPPHVDSMPAKQHVQHCRRGSLAGHRSVRAALTAQWILAVQAPLPTGVPEIADMQP